LLIFIAIHESQQEADMTFTRKAALIVVAISTASGAESLPVYTVSITSLGTGELISGFQQDGAPIRQTLEGYNATFVMTQLADNFYEGFIQGNPVDVYDQGGETIIRTPYYAGYGANVSGTLCAGLPLTLGISYFNPGCGSFSVNTGSPLGFGSTYNGRITSLRVTEGAVGDSILTAVIPEPSTWALMLAGFGMVGYAMRRRKAAFA
jgi:hypothetical protein